MSTQNLRRADPRSAATRASLLESAEALFAERGVDGVSLREIGAAIGAANTNVVAYHFGSKDALVEAILEHRLPGLEARRTALLETAGRRLSAEALVDAMFRPFLEQTSATGRHSYAAFLWGLFRSNRLASRVDLIPNYPVTAELVNRIREALPDHARARFDERLIVATGIVAAALHRIDQLGCTYAAAEDHFSDAVAMAVAALDARPRART